MNHRAILLAGSMLASLLSTACGIGDSAPGRPAAHSQVVRPSSIVDFNVLYARNCSACHGPYGKGGAAIGLSDPVFLAIADDATIRHITADGVPGTSMPAFAEHSGGTLTDDQVQAIVGGIRARWARPHALRDANPPPYATQDPGDPKRGAIAFGVYCSSCHGPDGRGGRAGSIVNGSYLALVSDQGLRTIVIAGRPELGHPDWRGDVPGRPMSAQDVSDVVAWLAAQRPQFPGRPYSTALQSGGGLR